jgi:2-oxoisovalerate dehydrogenase E2 component (dihydrolipoyl transacylase)
MAELREFRLPDVGEGLTEAEIVSWHVKPGDQVEVNQVIVEIETAKAVVELPSPWDGTVARLLAEEGQTIDVGVPIIAVDVSAAGTAAGDRTGSAERPVVPAPGPASASATAAAAAPPPAHQFPEDRSPAGPGSAGPPPAAQAERQPVLVGYGVKASATTRRARKHAPVTAAVAIPAAAAGPEFPAARALAKPPVRRLAKDLGIDLAALAGSGPEGSITREDVHRAAAGATVPPAGEVPANEARTAAGAAQPGPAGEERIPVRGVRKHTAAAMTSSAFTAPHVTMFLEIDITETMAAATRLRELPDFAGVRVSPLLLVAKALLVAAARHPMINSTWDEAAQEIVVKHYVNLGIAAATDRGLLVPSIKDAHALTLPELARALADLAAAARAGQSTPADLAGGSISITNVGVFGIDSGTPILPPGQAAILAFGQVKDGPWVRDGQLTVRKVCTLSLSFDHRIVDGDLGAAVLRDVGAMLAEPLHLLAWS